MKNENYNNIIKAFKQINALVIGDIILDEYFVSKENGQSPEANVKKYKVENHFYKIGGAGNVAVNLKSLNINTFLFGQIGKDNNGEILKDLLKKNNLYSNNIIKNSNFETTTKTRVISKKKHILRLDKENIKSYNNKLQLEKLFLNTIKNKKINLIIFQDYNKGFLTNQNIKKMIKIACKNKIFISVDPKNKNFFSYNNINLFKPNLNEINNSMQTKIKSYEINKLKKIIWKLDEKIKSKYIVNTIGANGILYTEKNKIYHSKPYKIKLIDPSGAGDVIITIISLLIKIKFDIHETMKIANKCGSIVCQKTGVYALKKADFKKSLEKI